MRRAGLVLLLLAGLALGVLSLAGSREQLSAGAAELSWGGLAAAGAAVLASLWCSLLSWRSTVAGLGAVLPRATAARIFFVGQLGKYVPGSVWPVVAQMELGAAYGLSRALVGSAALVTLGVAVPVALALGLLVVPALLQAGSSAYLLLFLALPLSAAAVSPPVINPVLARGLRLLRRPPLPAPLTAATLARTAGWAGAAHVLLGVHVLLLAHDLGAGGALLPLLAVGAFSLASVAGLLALPVPAGAGVREAVLVVALSPALSAGESLLLALVSRAILTVGDLTVAAAAARGVRHRVVSADDRGSAPSS